MDACDDRRTCPRVFEIGAGEVLLTGYYVDPVMRPGMATPRTPYLRFDLSVYPGSERLGYETLIADRAGHPELAPLTSDFYLFDGDEPTAFAVLMSYDHDGHWLGMWRTNDPPILDLCRR